MLITKLIEAIRKGGKEAQEAALVLGLLIEREKVHRPVPDDDGGIRQILGEEFVSRRLSDIEIKKAVDELISYMDETPVPHPGAIWALTKSYEPRTLPHLINLLDRFVGDPNQESLAYQALVGITSFYNDQSIAAIRRAASQGYGEVRETASQYLKLFSDRHSQEIQESQTQNLAQAEADFESQVPEHIETPDSSFAIEGETYMLQRRPMHPHIIVNDKYQGIRVLDPWRGTDILQVSFTEGYDSSGIINGWCFRSDGKAVLVLNEQTRNACLLSLEAEGSSYDLKSPPLKEITDLRYVWENDSFWLTSGRSFAYFNLQWQDGEPVFVERGSIHARIAHRAWCQALGRIQVLSSQVLRVEPDKAQMIYYDSSKHPETIGVLSWRDETKWSVPAVRYVPVMAFHKKHMFLMYEHEVHAINQQGMVEAIYNTPEGFYCCGLDTLPSQETYPAALVLACSSLSEPKHSQILVYRLDD